MDPTNLNMRWPRRFILRATGTHKKLGELTTAEVMDRASDNIKRRGIETATLGIPVSVNRNCYAVRTE